MWGQKLTWDAYRVTVSHIPYVEGLIFALWDYGMAREVH